MELSPRRFDTAVVVSPTGRIDQTNVETFQAKLMPHVQTCAEGQQQLVLDLSKLEYISSAGLRILMLAAKQARTQKGTFLLADLQPLVKEILEIGKFTAVLTVMPSLRDALAKVSPAALAAFERAA
jgi:anti-anti-sigma factor